MTDSLSPLQIAQFQRDILDFYERQGRDFPWRHTDDPYKILVSEIMLQQTQTERVLPKYTAWLERFPDVHTLSQASLADVLSLWSGLGYNRRARFLQQACASLSILLKQGKSFPDTPDALDALPGIGAYTARAVCTFSFNKPEVFIETNIRSVYLFFFYKEVPKEGIADKELLELIEQTLYRKNPKKWYYALMDYGAVLKKKVENPSRKSRHYTKQSPFKGSLRQARGAIIRALVQNTDNADRTGTGISLYDIQKKEKIDAELLQKAAYDLVTEKIISCDKNLYRIV